MSDLHHHDPRATVRAAGEFTVIDRATRGRAQPASVLLGPGDDAAIVRIDGGATVACLDMLVEHRHFRTDWSSGHDIGRKAIAQNAADLCAMGAVPVTFLVGLACPPDTPTSFTDALSDGLWAEAARFGAGISGGDLVQGRDITVSVTALGQMEGRDAITRSGARPGDVVALAGATGRSAAGLHLLEHGSAPASAAEEECIAVHRVPCPPYASALAAARAGASSMIDISDGLLSDLGHIARASSVTIDIDLGSWQPCSTVLAVAGAHQVDPWGWALDGGEDHAFAGTFGPRAPLPEGWSRIGTVSEGGPGVLVAGKPAAARGWTSWT
ncbi:thiamine-phosphate kinase [Lolliginicoccus lacisalsi]|uniref:thiamine-phosphate kinase n=1 Tax=Lolliginicoccus lacisalsi TaxID=2742202 RepID=UPI002FCE8C6F